MAKLKYATNRIPHNYTFWISDLAQLLSISKKTVSRWIKKEGLVHFEYAKKFHIHSSDLLAFLHMKNNKHKVKIPDGMVYCFKCKAARYMQTSTIGHKPASNRTQTQHGLCEVCGTKCNVYVYDKNI